MSDFGETTAVALIDYDNVKGGHERARRDVDENLAELIPVIVQEARQLGATISELVIRLYGGWIDERGRQSRNAQWLLAGLPWHRGRREGVIVKPAIATAIVAHADQVLIGSLRGWPEAPCQKMVDCMLAVDAIEFALQGVAAVLIVSDDDDLVPAALAARRRREGQRIVWLRRRRVGRGLNDAVLSRSGVVFGVLPGRGYGTAR